MKKIKTCNNCDYKIYCKKFKNYNKKFKKFGKNVLFQTLIIAAIECIFIP
jgi:hypothetical protein